MCKFCAGIQWYISQCTSCVGHAHVSDSQAKPDREDIEPNNNNSEVKGEKREYVVHTVQCKVAV